MISCRVAIGDHGRNLVISLWPGDKATINLVAALRLTLPPKIPSTKIRWKSSRLDYLGSRRHCPHWLSSKWPNYQRGVLLISAGAIEEHFEGKRGGNITKGVLFLHDNAPAHWALAIGLPELPMSWSPTLFSGSGPVGLPPVPWTEKRTIEMSPFFVRRWGHCCRGDLVGRTTFWIFFSGGLAKVRAMG